jgi:hypothetical protein
MRKIILLVVTLTLVALVIGFYPTRADKPMVDGTGPMAVLIAPEYPAPEYHSPLDWWQTHHMDAVNRGDFTKIDCVSCHEPERSCNNCHSYVGVDPITERKQ